MHVGVLALAARLTVSSLRAQQPSVIQTVSFNIPASGTIGSTHSYLFESYRRDSTSAVFNAFDPALGTLTAFEINWNLTFSGQTASPLSQINVSGGVDFDGELYSPGSVRPNGSTATLIDDETFQMGDPNSPFDAGRLAELSGSGLVGFEFTGTASITGNPGDDFTALTQGEATLTYFYTAAVPEPGVTGAVIGAAVLLAVGFVRSGRTFPKTGA